MFMCLIRNAMAIQMLRLPRQKGSTRMSSFIFSRKECSENSAALVCDFWQVYARRMVLHGKVVHNVCGDFRVGNGSAVAFCTCVNTQKSANPVR